VSARTTSGAVPLVSPRPAVDVLSYGSDRIVTVAGFLADVAALAERLPRRAHVVNLCADRYRFTVTFAAALVRRQTNLLPPQRTPDFLARLADAYPELYCLADEDVAWCPLEAMRYPRDLRPASSGPPPAIPDDHVAAIAFTSGTTGEPTPHFKRWGPLARGALAEARALGLDRTPGATLVGTVPAQHMYGFESTVLLALQNRLAMHAGRPFYAGDIGVALAEVPAPRVLVTTPVHLRALEIDGGKLPPLALIVSATAPLGEDAAAQAEARHGAAVHEIYGFTEAGMVASRRTTEGEAWRLLPGVRLRRDGRDWWAEDGHVPTPGRFADLIDVLDDGRFVLRGRGADLINVAGKRASLAALNAHLLAIPGVVDGAFYLPGEDRDKVARLAAFVVAPGLTRRGVLAALRERVDSVFLPRPVHFVERLPRNATGKLPLESLRRLALEQSKR